MSGLREIWKAYGKLVGKTKEALNISDIFRRWKTSDCIKFALIWLDSVGRDHVAGEVDSSAELYFSSVEFHACGSASKKYGLDADVEFIF